MTDTLLIAMLAFIFGVAVGGFVGVGYVAEKIEWYHYLLTRKLKAEERND